MAVRRPGCGHGGWPDALPALEVPGVRAAFEEGDEAEVDFDAATVTNLRSGTRLVGAPWPDMLMKSLRADQLTICVRAFGACLQKRRESCLWRAIQINLCWLAAYQ
jgi:hypothetical protein